MRDAATSNRERLDSARLDSVRPDSVQLEGGPSDAPGPLGDATARDVSTMSDAAGPVTYTANVAACTAPLAPSTSDCATGTGTGKMTVDLDDGGVEYHSYVSFILVGWPAARTPTSVKLRLHTGNTGGAKSNQTGEVYLVEAFTFESLSTGVPATIGDAVGQDKGAVVPDQVVEWILTLPPGIVGPGKVLYLGILPVTDNAANYWNADAENDPNVRPRLVIE